MKSPTESQSQQAVFEWAEWNINCYPDLEWMYAIPNGGLRHKAVAAKLKAEGVKSGVSDIHLPVPKGRYIGLWIELKVGKNKPTEKQLRFQEQMREYGHYACVCYGAAEAIAKLEWYLTDRS